MRVSVLGAGYLGATHAAALAAIGHDVVVVDVDADRVARLSTGRAPFYEPRLDELLTHGIAAGRLAFVTRAERAAEHAKVHFLCVGTPQADGTGAADLRDVWAAVESICPGLRPGALLVGKSTVPVGTALRLQARMRELSATDVEVAWNPEFLREGHAIEDSLHPDRLVLGVATSRAEQILRQLYAPLIYAGVDVIRTDRNTAELAKVSANAMLAARLSVVNVFAEVCEAANASVLDLVSILGSDPRIGSSYLTPGLGFGGGCLPKDIRGFVARAEELGAGRAVQLLREVDATNTRQRARTAELATSWLAAVRGRRVAILGAAFKGGSDDVRDSPALAVAEELSRGGAEVRVYDPMALAAARRACPQLDYRTDVTSACADVDLILVLTDWDEFESLDPVALREVVAHPQIVDTRQLLDATKWGAAGWRIHVLGNGR
ncbi:MAG: UDP-glucose dehydrogenase family protein [Nocardioidaceae bacterium]